MGSRPKLLEAECSECWYVDEEMSIPTNPSIHWCNLVNNWQPSRLFGKKIHCDKFKRNTKEWDI